MPKLLNICWKIFWALTVFPTYVFNLFRDPWSVFVFFNPSTGTTSRCSTWWRCRATGPKSCSESEASCPARGPRCASTSLNQLWWNVVMVRLMFRPNTWLYWYTLERSDKPVAACLSQACAPTSRSSPLERVSGWRMQESFLWQSCRWTLTATSVRDSASRSCSVGPSAWTTTPPPRSPSRKWNLSLLYGLNNVC